MCGHLSVSLALCVDQLLLPSLVALVPSCPFVLGHCLLAGSNVAFAVRRSPASGSQTRGHLEERSDMRDVGHVHETVSVNLVKLGMPSLHRVSYV